MGGRSGGRREAILAVLREAAEPRSITDIAEVLEVHPNTVRFHLDALVRAQRVDRVQTVPDGPGRPPLRFRARTGMDPAGPRNYHFLAETLVESVATGPDPAAHARRAGLSWGQRFVDRPASSGNWAEGVRSLVAVLDDVGFDPEWPAAGHREDQIALRHCPFLELALTRAEVVCPLHLGLMQGAMRALDLPIIVERLEPFASPNLCVGHLSPIASGDSP
ncbi:MAG: transcriptional regulator [Pseudonocardia sp. SCN 72-51]|nr:MAG: transcriptional regulator [Pseudonocardia sp. SCN 72-51]